MGDEDINQNQHVQVYKTFDDGYVVRRMRSQDAPIVQKWYCGMGIISKFDLEVALSSYPAQDPGFYIGEYNGEVVASAIRIPWGNGVFYGSYYYVAEAHRRAGFGTRLRDQVAREYVGDNILCVDAVIGKVADTNKAKHGYSEAFKTGRFQVEAKQGVVDISGTRFKLATEIPFEEVIAYDNKRFVSANFPQRRVFLKSWISLPGGASYVVQNDQGQVVGLGCRRVCIQPGHHMVGPLYADDATIANCILQRLCNDVIGEQVTLQIWYPNEDAVKMVEKFNFRNVFDIVRMHVNGDPKEFKPTTFALTSIDICGF